MRRKVKTMDKKYEIKLAGEKQPVIWEGKDGIDACKRYAESHPGTVVIAWRDYPRHGVFLVDTRQVKG